MWGSIGQRRMPQGPLLSSRMDRLLRLDRVPNNIVCCSFYPVWHCMGPFFVSFTLGECCHTIQGSLVGCLHRRYGVGFYPFRSQEESIMKFFTSDYAAVYSSAKS